MKNKIFAIDIEDKDEISLYTKKIMEDKKFIQEIFALKVGLLSIINNGISIVKEIKKNTGLPIICDVKLSDIPRISSQIAEIVDRSGADYIIVHGFVGEEVIKLIKQTVPNLRIILVSEMTHNEGGFTHQYLDQLLALAMKMKVFGIIGPGNRPSRLKRIKEVIGDEIKLIAAGISEQQGGEAREALVAGADYLIEGTNIRKELDSISNHKNTTKQIRTKRLFLAIIIYSIVGLVLGLVLLNLVKTPLEGLTEDPLLSIIVTAVYAIIGVIFFQFHGKRK